MTGTIDIALLGQLLGTALACGFNLYAAVAALGIASRLGWTDALPPDLRGLEHGIVIASAVILYLAELVVDKIRYLDSAWDAVHTIIRPLAAGLLAALALGALPVTSQIAAGVAAAAAALLAHAGKAGGRIALDARGRRDLVFRVSVAEDLLAVALIMAVLFAPRIAAAAALLIILVLAASGPPLWRAAWLGARSVDGRLRAFFGSPGWRERADLPAAVASLVERDDLGIAPPRAMRVAVDRLPGAGPFRNGWLVLQRDRAAFVYRSFLRPRRIELPPAPITDIRPGALLDVVRLDGDAGFTLFLLKDGPPLDVATAELRSASQ